MGVIACNFADQWMQSIQAAAQGIRGYLKLVVSRQEKGCRDPRPLSTPSGEHLRVGHVLAQFDTVKLHQGIALPINRRENEENSI
jgi:hypothetical protein